MCDKTSEKTIQEQDAELTQKLVKIVAVHFDKDKLTLADKARISAILTSTLAISAGQDFVHHPILKALEAAAPKTK